MRKSRIIIILLGVIVLGLAAFILVIVKNALDNIGGRSFTIKEEIELNETWKPIDLEEIKFPEKEQNTLDVESSLRMRREGFVSPNGEIFLPQVMLEDFKGNKCFLEYKVPELQPPNSISFDEDNGCFSSPNSYKKLWMKSPVVFNAKIIYWGANAEDLK